jgi:hypothetical protein
MVQYSHYSAFIVFQLLRTSDYRQSPIVFVWFNVRQHNNGYIDVNAKCEVLHR